MPYYNRGPKRDHNFDNCPVLPLGGREVRPAPQGQISYSLNPLKGGIYRGLYRDYIGEHYRGSSGGY